MAATHRSDSSAYVVGCHHSGDRGLGVLGSQIPSAGVHGPALLYSGLSLPAEANDEFRILILTVPAGLESLFVQEDSSATADPVPDGVYAGTYEAFKNGASYGVSSYRIAVGAAVAPVRPINLGGYSPQKQQDPPKVLQGSVWISGGGSVRVSGRRVHGVAEHDDDLLKFMTTD